MHVLKELTVEGIPRALWKAERYRLLGEPCEAESIYRDILALDAQQREARIGLILSLTDQFRTDLGRVAEAKALASEMESEYERCYYTGVAAERLGKAQLNRGSPGSDDYANRAIREAMTWYERAQALRPPGDDDSLLRWNACARTLDRLGFAEPADMLVPDVLTTK